MATFYKKTGFSKNRCFCIFSLSFDAIEQKKYCGVLWLVASFSLYMHYCTTTWWYCVIVPSFMKRKQAINKCCNDFFVLSFLHVLSNFQLNSIKFQGGDTKEPVFENTFLWKLVIFRENSQNFARFREFLVPRQRRERDLRIHSRSFVRPSGAFRKNHSLEFSEILHEGIISFN